MSARPDFSASELVRSAYAFAASAHEGPGRGGGTEIEHPLAVAEALLGAGFDDEVVAAALLHDVVEDTGGGLGEISERFGARVCDLVQTMTEDESIEPYAARKDEHRRRVLAGGRDPASIYLADKLARTGSYLARDERPDPDRLAHYRRTLELFGDSGLRLPFVDEVRRRIERLESTGGDEANGEVDGR